MITVHNRVSGQAHLSPFPHHLLYPLHLPPLATVHNRVSGQAHRSPFPHHLLYPLHLPPLAPPLRQVLLPPVRLLFLFPLVPHLPLPQTMLGLDGRTCVFHSVTGTMLQILGDRNREHTSTHFQNPLYRPLPSYTPRTWIHRIQQDLLIQLGPSRDKSCLNRSNASMSRQRVPDETCLASFESTAINLSPNTILRLRSTANFFLTQ